MRFFPRCSWGARDSPVVGGLVLKSHKSVSPVCNDDVPQLDVSHRSRHVSHATRTFCVQTELSGVSHCGDATRNGGCMIVPSVSATQEMSCGFYKARTADCPCPSKHPLRTNGCRPGMIASMKRVGRARTRGAWLLTIAFLGTLLSTCGTTPNSSGDEGSGPHTVSLNWNTSMSSNVVGYNIYRGTTSGSYALLKSMNSNTSYLDTSVQSGQTYYYVVTAVDAAGAESPYSNTAEAVIP